MFLGKCAGSIEEEAAAAERSGRRAAKPANSDPDRAPESKSSPAAATQRVTSSSLFRGGRLLLIEHAGNEYRLQITSRGKLILTR